MGLPKEKITIFIYMSEIENYDYRIRRNFRINDEKLKRYRYGVIALFGLPIVLGIVYFGCSG